MESKNGLNIFFQKQIPSRELSEVVAEYTFREISLEAGSSIRKVMPCRHVSSIDFFIGESYNTSDISINESLPFLRSTIRGPRVQCKYRIDIFQHFVCFSIRFKPSGLYRLLGIPMQEFADQAVEAQLVVPAFENLLDQLSKCKDLTSCIALAEPFLLRQLKRVSQPSRYITVLADQILLNKGCEPIKNFYNQIPQCSRHLERTFIKEVGVSPKTYSNLIRLQNVMQAKNRNPQEKWSSIAYDFSYFDQMHLVKDFRKYLGITPKVFQPQDFAL